jgi:nitroimidazol reductase NimA-like FMN-containing flavoprotein (pyridoxamine 5'-phosphate oxidase superfamily)
MDDSSTVALDADDRDAFLGRGGTGVISFATDEAGPPHAVPVSYGYDAVDEAFYFRLAVDGEKDDVEGRAVSFVVHGETDDGWQSVVAEGTLTSTTDADVATAALEGLQRVEIPYVDIFGRPMKDVDFAFVRLDPDEFTARGETVQPE